MVLEKTQRIPEKLQFSEFMEYFVSPENAQDDGFLPSMQELSQELGISQSKLREQLEVAKAMGLVEVHPRTGIQRLSYSFLPAVKESLMIALALDCWKNFEAFSELRNQVEAAFWHQAVGKLTESDKLELQSLIDLAWEKMRAHPVQIPHREHRELHLRIYSRMENPFVQGILEAFWQAYERVGLNLFADYDYLEEVWRYHTQMVESICNGDFDAGHEALVSHKDLLFHRPSLPRGDKKTDVASGD